MSALPQHLVGLRFLSKDVIDAFVDRTLAIKSQLESSDNTLKCLPDKTVVNLFFEASTRTRVSFEIAIKKLGATSLNISKSNSSLVKGETLYDTVANIEAMGVDAIIVRHPNSGAPHFIANWSKIPVINAGDGVNEHPTQGLLDITTMIEKKGPLKGKHVLILGDILHSRVARSNIWGLTKMGAKVYVSGPSTLIPVGIEKMGVTVVPHPSAILKKIDIVNVLRVQYERQHNQYFPSICEYRQLFGLTKSKLNGCKDDILIMHPGPINRGIEIDSDVADGKHNVILHQVKNGIALRMAVLERLLQEPK